jgi:hypothetical protein
MLTSLILDLSPCAVFFFVTAADGAPDEVQKRETITVQPRELKAIAFSVQTDPARGERQSGYKSCLSVAMAILRSCASSWPGRCN